MSAQPITAEQVEEFMRAAAARLAEKCGESYAIVSVSFNNANIPPEWKSYAHGGHWLTGATCETVIDAQVAEVAPVLKAARLRADAKKLLALAAQLECGK